MLFINMAISITCIMANIIKPQIQPLKLGQGDNLAKMHRGDAANVLGVAGSMRKGSFSTHALKLVLEEAKKYGSDSRVLELREVRLPIYDPSRSVSEELYQDINGNRENVLDTVTAAIKWADAFVLASPDYHGSMSGAMKNFLDYFWEEFAGKTFGYIIASHEKGLTVADQMRTSVRQCYGWSMPYNISINGTNDFNSAGNPINSSLANRIKMLARDLVTYGTLIRRQFLQDVMDKEVSDSYASRYREHYN
jgi:NAD(P)H-dependent FMN reductase